MKTLLQFRDLALLAYQGEELSRKTISPIYFCDELGLCIPHYVYEILNHLKYDVLTALADSYRCGSDNNEDDHQVAHNRLCMLIEHFKKKRTLDIPHIRSIGRSDIQDEMYFSIINEMDELAQEALFHTVEFDIEGYYKILDICDFAFSTDTDVTEGVRRIRAVEEQLKNDIEELTELSRLFYEQDEFLCVDNIQLLGETRDNLLASFIRLRLAEWFMYDDLAAAEFVEVCESYTDICPAYNDGLLILRRILESIQ